jgi:hypothetical protein
MGYTLGSCRNHAVSSPALVAGRGVIDWRSVPKQHRLLLGAAQPKAESYGGLWLRDGGRGCVVVCPNPAERGYGFTRRKKPVPLAGTQLVVATQLVVLRS